jgi:4-hydroxy-tetrahydrodipicolinate synthase
LLGSFRNPVPAVPITELKRRLILLSLREPLQLFLGTAREGAEYIVVHAPLPHFGHDIDSTVYEYYRHVADCPTVVAIKYSVPRDMYAELSRQTHGQLIVSSAAAAEWLDNIIELGWRLYLCSIPPILLQTAKDKRIRRYTDLAFSGEHAAARTVRDSLEPARAALRDSRPPGTPQAQQKYWQNLLGQTGGPVRRPLLNLTGPQQQSIAAAFARSGVML